MRQTLIVLVVLAFVCVCASANAQDECVTDVSSFWVCEGDPAWDTGYLIPPDVIDLRKVILWEEKAKLADELRSQIDEIQTQRDSALGSFRQLQKDYDELDDFSSELQADYNQAINEVDDRYTTWEVVGISGLTGAGSIALGILIGALAI